MLIIGKKMRRLINRSKSVSFGLKRHQSHVEHPYKNPLLADFYTGFMECNHR
jgi:hypothetical protein